MPTMAFTDGTRTRNRASRALRLRSPRDTPLPLPMNVLLLRWDTKPDKRIRRTFLHPATTRRTSFYAASRIATHRKGAARPGIVAADPHAWAARSEPPLAAKD